MDPNIINSVFPISRIDIYRNGVVVKRKCKLQSGNINEAKRSEIKELSKKSLSRLAFMVHNTDVKFLSLLTLTYPRVFPHNGTESKAHLRNMLNYLQYEYPYLEYLWILEFQTKRLAPHYHILLNVLEPNKYMRQQAAMEWSKVVSRETTEQGKVFRVHNHPNNWEKIRDKDGAMKYMSRYALKPHQKKVPQSFSKVGRFWGCSAAVKPKPLVKDVDITTEEAESYVSYREKRFEKMSWLPKYIWFK